MRARSRYGSSVPFDRCARAFEGGFLANLFGRIAERGLYAFCCRCSGQKLATMLTHRKLLQSKAIAIENDLRGTLRNFGLKVGMAGTVKFETRIKELVANSPELAALVEPLLVVRRVLREQLVILHRRLLAIVRDDEVCQRLNPRRLKYQSFEIDRSASNSHRCGDAERGHLDRQTAEQS